MIELALIAALNSSDFVPGNSPIERNQPEQMLWARTWGVFSCGLVKGEGMTPAAAFKQVMNDVILKEPVLLRQMNRYAQQWPKRMWSGAVEYQMLKYRKKYCP